MNFNTLFAFEKALAEYTGAPYVVVTDCCTHAIDLCMRIDNVYITEFTAFTYLSIPQLMRNLNINYRLTDERWTGEYQFHGTNIWDSARRLERGMYRSGQKQCLSFGNRKPLQLGRCGAILLDSIEEYRLLSRMRSDGRDLTQSPWQDHPISEGYHYCPTLENCALGIKLLPTINESPKYYEYPDCRQIKFNDL
jgi:dTDP-4-amino-4,6-dideoxygalactose transaminase